MSRRRSRAPGALRDIVPAKGEGRQWPIASLSATRYAHAAARDVNEGTARDLQGFPLHEPGVYLVMQTAPSNARKKTDWLGLSKEDMRAAWDQLSVGDAGAKAWPALTVGGFSRNPHKGLVLATAFFHMWKAPHADLYPLGNAWEEKVKTHRYGDALSLKHLNTEFKKGGAVCDETDCWGERVHTLALLLEYPLWKAAFLRVYCFHPSFQHCFDRARARAQSTVARFPELYPPADTHVSFFTFYDVRKLEQEGDDASDEA